MEAKNILGSSAWALIFVTVYAGMSVYKHLHFTARHIHIFSSGINSFVIITATN